MSITNRFATENYVDESVNQLTGDYIAEAVDAYFVEHPASGLTTEQISALDNMFKVCAFIKADVSTEYNVFKAAFGITDSDDSGESGGDTGGDTGDVSNETKWTDGVAYTYTSVKNQYVETNGALTDYSGWDRTPYLYCANASKLRITVQVASSMLSSNCQYNVFYDVDKNFIKAFNYGGIGTTVGAYKDIEVPENAAYFIASHKGDVISGTADSAPYVEFVPYA